MAINLGVNAIKELNLGNSKIRKAYLGNTKIYDINQVPANYTKVNFVKQDVSQHEILDLDIPFDWDWSFEIDFRQVSISNSGFTTYETLCGTRIFNGNSLYYRPNQNNKWCISYTQIYNDSYATNVLPLAIADTERHVVKSKKIIYNSNNVIEGYIDNKYISRGVPLYNIGVSSFCLYGSSGTVTRMVDQLEVYNLKLYDGDGILKCNLIPVKRNSDNAPGFYDLVRRRFFTAQFLIAGDVLPYDEEIEYLESNGYAYIKTGISGDARIVGCAQSTEIKNTSQIIVGSSQGDAATWIGGVSTTQNWGLGTSSDTYIDALVTTKAVFDIIFTATGASGTINNISVSRSVNNATNLEWYIFRGHNSFPFSGKIFYLKIYQNDVLVRDLIPVRKGNVGYLYDKVTNQLFGNSGTGDFILGKDKTWYSRIEYLQCDGNQYINTGIKHIANNNYEVDVTILQEDTNYRNILGASSDGTNGEFYLSGKHNEYYLNNKQLSSDFLDVNDRVILTLYQYESYTALYKNNNFVKNADCNLFNIIVMLMARNRTSPKLIGKVYSFKISNNSLIQHLVPIRIEDKGCMYDKVTGQIFVNKGTGDFILGPDI